MDPGITNRPGPASLPPSNNNLFGGVNKLLQKLTDKASATMFKVINACNFDNFSKIGGSSSNKLTLDQVVLGKRGKGDEKAESAKKEILVKPKTLRKMTPESLKEELVEENIPKVHVFPEALKLSEKADSQGDSVRLQMRAALKNKSDFAVWIEEVDLGAGKTQTDVVIHDFRNNLQITTDRDNFVKELKELKKLKPEKLKLTKTGAKNKEKEEATKDDLKYDKQRYTDPEFMDPMVRKKLEKHIRDQKEKELSRQLDKFH